MVPRCAGCVDVSMHPMKCEAHSRNEAENLPFATNRLVKIDDLKAKIESDDESKNPRQKHLKAKLKAETFLAQSELDIWFPTPKIVERGRGGEERNGSAGWQRGGRSEAQRLDPTQSWRCQRISTCHGDAAAQESATRVIRGSTRLLEAGGWWRSRGRSGRGLGCCQAAKSWENMSRCA